MDYITGNIVANGFFSVFLSPLYILFMIMVFRKLILGRD